MADSELKPTGFRLTSETQQRFREICKELGGNQQEAMAALIETYEYEAGKQALPEQQVNIETFEGYLRAASQMYRQLLENLQGMRTVIRTEYEEELKSKDSLITDLHKKLTEAEQKEAEAVSRLQENIAASEKQNRAYEEQLAIFENKNAELTKTLSESEKRRAEDQNFLLEARKGEASFKAMFLEAQTELSRCKAELNKISSDYKTSYDMVGKLTRDKLELEKQLGELTHQLEKSKLEKDAQKEKTEIATQLELQRLENSLREEYTKRIEVYQNKIETLLNKETEAVKHSAEHKAEPPLES